MKLTSQKSLSAIFYLLTTVVYLYFFTLSTIEASFKLHKPPLFRCAYGRWPRWNFSVASWCFSFRCSKICSLNLCSFSSSSFHLSSSALFKNNYFLNKNNYHEIASGLYENYLLKGFFFFTSTLLFQNNAVLLIYKGGLITKPCLKLGNLQILWIYWILSLKKGCQDYCASINSKWLLH